MRCQIDEPVKPLTCVTPSCGRGARGVLHPLGGALPHAFRVAVAADLGRQDRAVALVDPVADRLADEVRADRPHAEAVALEQLAAPVRVAAVGERLVDLEVVAPAGELEPVEAPAAAASRRAPRAAGRPTGR